MILLGTMHLESGEQGGAGLGIRWKASFNSCLAV